VPGKINEGHDGNELEKRERYIRRRSFAPNLVGDRDDIIRRNLIAVDPNALGK
jgi:hypothetical protein